VDVTDRGGDKREDSYAARNDKVSELWRPGAGFKPTSFTDIKGPKVQGVRDILHPAGQVPGCMHAGHA
jgi:hypothetical protein